MKLQNILKGFTKTLNQLDALVRSNSKQIDDNFQNIFKLEEQNEALNTEVGKALSIAENIRKLLGETK